MAKKTYKIFLMVVILSMLIPFNVFGMNLTQSAGSVTVTILHTNDFHGQLEASGSNPGGARLAKVIKDIVAANPANTLVVDAGDEMQGSLLSNLQKGSPVIATFNAIGYSYATFGNHEFDWGQAVLADRTAQATYDFISANIVASSDCATPGWAIPAFVKAPYRIKDVAGAKVAFIGVTTQEVPTITLAANTAGICFVDPALAIEHYYPEIKAAGADAIVVLSHLGFNDGGYGYGINVYGDKTLATKLNTDGKPVDLIIGGHSHTDMKGTATKVGNTTIGQAYYNGRKVGQATLTLDTTTHTASVAWTDIAVSTTAAVDPAVNTLITGYASDPAYMALINQPIGYTKVDLAKDYNYDNMMGNFVDDAIYNYLNTDVPAENDIDMFFNNAGGIRTDWCAIPDPDIKDAYKWSSTHSDCTLSGVYSHDPMLLTYGNMFTVLPFGNATVVGTMTGAQIMDVLNQAGLQTKGSLQPAGIRYKYYNYKDSVNCGASCPATWAWGAFDVQVYDKGSSTWVALDANKTYKVGTNEFLAPAGGDNFAGFKYMQNITYWGDMLNAVDAYVSNHYGTPATAYKGPNGDGTLDGRITRDGTETSGSIIPVSVLHNNDEHGRLVPVPAKKTAGLDQLATVVKIERQHNPSRTILLNGGDAIQGDSMAYYFKDAGGGVAADGSVLPTSLQTNPIIAALNAMNYTGFVLGNHEFNFGSKVFVDTFSKASFPILGANVTDSGAYGMNKVSALTVDGKPVVNVRDSLSVSLPSCAVSPCSTEPITVGILGLTNHRVPSYELPSNILGLTFLNPIQTAKDLVPALRASNDVVVALTHIGFTTDPKSIDVDENVDTNLAAQVAGIDAIIGSHSHTNPLYGSAPYKYLPALVANPEGKSVLINQAANYNAFLGEVILGVRAKTGGGYEVVSTAGKDIPIDYLNTPEDPAIKAIADAYTAQLTAYNNLTIGSTTQPIDTMKAYSQETNGANLQADASVYELQQNGIAVDFHLSGAMTNSHIADTATPANPVSLKVSDMFTAMPYENSLLVINMNGPQIKAVLERSYRNWYFYTYVPDHGGYSYYPTCMLDINAGGKITYNTVTSLVPNGNNVVSLTFNGKSVDFANTTTYYKVSTVNYLAAGACNMSDAGVTLWPLSQIANDTQFYVRDAVIDYVKAKGTISPITEGRLNFLRAYNYYAPLVQQAFDPANYVNVQVLALNDFHGALTTTKTTGGVEAMASYVKHFESLVPNTVFVSGGDLIGASPLLSGLFHDEPTIAAFNLMGLDYAAVGNHEFDEGVTELRRMQNGGCNPVDGCKGPGGTFAGASFKFLASNVLMKADDTNLFPSYMIRDFGGTKVAFIGVSLESTPEIVTASGTAEVKFTPEAAAINSTVAKLRTEQGIHAFVVIVHDGTSCPAGNALVNATDPDVDVFVMGHSHATYNCVINNKIVTQAGSAGANLTNIYLTIDKTTDQVFQKTAAIVPIVKADVPVDAAITALLDAYKTISDPLANAVIGSITADITRTGTESSLGDLIADGMLESTSPIAAGGAVISFMNPGGIRTDLLYSQISGGEAAGQVTYGEAFAVQPFSNNMITMTMTGAQLKLLLESQYGGGCTKLQISNGFTYTVTASAVQGSRISNIKLDGVAIDPVANYRISTNNFLAGGGDGCTIFTQGTNLLAGMIDLDTFVAYLGVHSPVSPTAHDRITFLP